MALRPCDLCRKYHYDENTGMPSKDRHGNFRMRRGPVPCELPGDVSTKCMKGHWKDKPDLNDRQQAVLRFWWSVRGTMGGCLTEEHRRSRWLMRFLGELTEEYESCTRMAQASELKAFLLTLVRHE